MGNLCAGGEATDAELERKRREIEELQKKRRSELINQRKAKRITPLKEKVQKLGLNNLGPASRGPVLQPGGFIDLPGFKGTQLALRSRAGAQASSKAAEVAEHGAE